MFHEFTQLVADASGWAYADSLPVRVPGRAGADRSQRDGGHHGRRRGSLRRPQPGADHSRCGGGSVPRRQPAYLIGHRFGARATERFFSGEKARHRMDWAEEQLTRARRRADHRRSVHPRRAHRGRAQRRHAGLSLAALHRVRRRCDARLGHLLGAPRLLRRKDVRELLGSRPGPHDGVRDRRRHRARALGPETAPQAGVVTSQRPGFVPAAILTGAGTA